MTVTELFTAIRASYVALLSATAQKDQAHIEPAYRNADGTLALEGNPALPCRADFIPKTGPFAGEAYTVDANSQLEFEPVHFQLSATDIHIQPFTWDWLNLQVHGLQPDIAGAILADWFMAYFDGEDENQANEQGLYGVVHFMSAFSQQVQQVQQAQALQLTIDLGSVPGSALEDLMLRLSDAGAQAVHLG
ncbi:hypothetical protein ACO0LF_15105 [Undibacterium sp. Di27W]|uniref:hypothetical protein n=1 Tax=Undibacterium sp. Di27W TaxID=3413036 RepID=UPI003BF2872E